MENFVTVATLYSLAAAEPERLALEAAGIPAIATDEDVGSLLVPYMVGGIKLQVPAADAARAEEILAELRKDAHPAGAASDADEGASFQCPTCKAEIWFPSERRGHVENCPECGAYVDVPTANVTAE